MPLPVLILDAQVEEARRDLDAIDAAIVSLLRIRLRKSIAIAHRKAALGVAVYDPERERVIVERVEAGAVRDLYGGLVAGCRAAGEAAVSSPVDGGDPSAPADGSQGR